MTLAWLNKAFAVKLLLGIRDWMDPPYYLQWPTMLMMVLLTSPWMPKRHLRKFLPYSSFRPTKNPLVPPQTHAQILCVETHWESSDQKTGSAKRCAKSWSILSQNRSSSSWLYRRRCYSQLRLRRLSMTIREQTATVYPRLTTPFWYSSPFIQSRSSLG